MKGGMVAALLGVWCLPCFAIGNPNELLAAAEQGDADAQCLYGMQIFLGGPLMDPRLAGALTTKQMVESKIYEWLNKVDEQYVVHEKQEMSGGGLVGKMVEWLEKSAAQGNKYGQYCLGICKKKGLGTALDLDGAFRLFAASAEQKYGKAEAELGWEYLFGRGTQKDPKKAFVCFQKASLCGDSKAKVGLGFCFLKGLGIPQDEKKSGATI